MDSAERGHTDGRATSSSGREPDGRSTTRVARRLGIWRPNWTSLVLFVLAATGVVQFYDLPAERGRRPFARLAAGIPAGASLNAFGISHELRLRFTLPGGSLEFPIQVGDDPASLAYQWVPADDTTPVDSARALAGARVVAPEVAGFYRLALVRSGVREILPAPLVAVMVPFTDKVHGILNGYRIGTYLAERLRHHLAPDDAPPAGFVEVKRSDADLRVSDHFRLGDFITHDGQQDVWPKYVALNPRLLDKLELVIAQIAHDRGDSTANGLSLDVHSGFRTPLHNQRVERSARDSRHQYGDAADIAVDVDGDGRVTVKDERLVERAVDEVEATHPDLVGGLGLYTSRRYRTPYVHIDARGVRSRWRG